MTENIIIAILAFIGSVIGACVVYIAAMVKLKPEIRHIRAETGQTDAEAAGSWAQSNELAAKQLVQLQQDVIAMRSLLKEASIRINSLEIQHEIQSERIKRLESQIHSLGMEPVK